MRGITFKVVVENKADTQSDNRVPEFKKPTARTHHASKQLEKVGLTAIAAAALITLALFGWKFYQQQRISDMDPFTVHTRSLVSFPLYYPTKLPNGYHTDKTSVTNPDKGVIVFNLTDQSNERFIYISEEAKPTEFNFQGYYSGFGSRQSIKTQYGTAVLGLVALNGRGHEELGSLATDKTWVIANTNNNVPLNQLEYVLTSLVLSR